MLDFKMFAKIQFHREIDTERDYISPGSYEMVMSGKTIRFDFMTTRSGKSKDNPCVLEVECINPDTSFDDVELITEDMLRDITKIEDFYVYSETDNKDCGKDIITPAALLELYFEVDTGDDFATIEVAEDVRNNVDFTK